MSTKFLSPGWRMPRNANQSKITNYSLDFDGTDHVNAGRILSAENTSTLSVSFWLKIPSIGAKSYLGYFIGNFGAGWLVEANASSIFFALGDTGTSYQAFTLPYSGNIAINTWYHIVMVYDGNQTGSANILKVYINGTQKTLSGSPSFPSSIPTLSGAEFTIGGIKPTSVSGVKSISSVSIFDYALSQSQVTTLWGGGTSVSNPMALPSSPVAYYPLGTSAWNGQYLSENNAIGDYVFDTNGNSSKYFNLRKTSVGSDDFTFSFWVKPKSYAGGGGDAGDTLLGNTNGTPSANQWTMWVYEPDGKIRLVWYNQTNSSGNFMLTDFSFGAGTINQEWVQVVLTRVGTTVTFYFNGVADTATPGTLSSSSITLDDSSNATMRLPSPWGGAIYNQDGFYSNLLWHNVGLSSTEVETLYNYGSPIQTLANIPQSSNLKAWYKLDATEIYNSSTTEWEVNNALSPWTSSLDFNRAASDSISLGSSSSIRPTGDYTFSIWYNLSSSSLAGVWSVGTNINNSGLSLFKGNSGGLELYHKGTSSTSAFVTLGSASGTLNIWQNAIFTYDDTSRVIKGYLNGDLISTVSVAGTGSVSWANNFYLGRLVQSGSYYLDGRLSNFQIFNTALPATGSNSVETLYNSGNPLTYMSSFSSLVSWWKLDNTTTGIEDSKGSNNGTNNGATEVYGSVSTLNGESTGMSQTNLIQSNLQTVAPYSKYALNFDGTNDYIDCGDVPLEGVYTISFWINPAAQPSGLYFLFDKGDGGSDISARVSQSSNNTVRFQIGSTDFSSTDTLTNNSWNNVILIANGSSSKIYINNGTAATGSLTTAPNTTQSFFIATDNAQQVGYFFNGSISNVSIWNTALTSSQVREIYNEGLPSNLHNFSGTAPVAWWQLGENSSYVSGWTFADEVASNNGTGYGLAETDLTNGVGTTANGTSTGMSEDSLVGDAPYSTANAVSSGMAVTARGTNVP